MKKERMSVGMGLNLLLLMAMVAANILSFYHLSSTRSISPSSLPSHFRSQLQEEDPDAVPDHLLRQLHTIRATISRLQQHEHHPSSSSSISPPPELLLYSKLSPIASACSDNPILLHRYMNYTPFSLCPPDGSPSLAESLALRGCHPLPRRRCLSRKNGGAIRAERDSRSSLLQSKSALNLTLPQLFTIVRAAAGASPLTLALDVGGGAASLAAALQTLSANVTVLTTTMDLGSPNSESAARKGFVPLHLPLQQRFPMADGTVDLVRTGHGVNRWIPEVAMEFLMADVDRVLRGGGLFWVDHFSCKGGDLERVYGKMIARLGYKRIKWAVGNKTDGNGVKFGEVYLTALLQKPKPVPASI